MDGATSECDWITLCQSLGLFFVFMLHNVIRILLLISSEDKVIAKVTLDIFTFVQIIRSIFVLLAQLVDTSLVNQPFPETLFKEFGPK